MPAQPEDCQMREELMSNHPPLQECHNIPLEVMLTDDIGQIEYIAECITSTIQLPSILEAVANTLAGPPPLHQSPQHTEMQPAQDDSTLYPEHTVSMPQNSLRWVIVTGHVKRLVMEAQKSKKQDPHCISLLSTIADFRHVWHFMDLYR